LNYYIVGLLLELVFKIQTTPKGDGLMVGIMEVEIVHKTLINNKKCQIH
jgi:hypothetical protein